MKIAIAEGVGFSYSAGAQQGNIYIDVGLDKIISDTGLNLGTGSGYALAFGCIPTTPTDGPFQAYAGVGRIYLPLGVHTIDAPNASAVYDTVDSTVADEEERLRRPELINSFALQGVSSGNIYQARSLVSGSEITSAGLSRFKVRFGLVEGASLQSLMALRSAMQKA